MRLYYYDVIWSHGKISCCNFVSCAFMDKRFLGPLIMKNKTRSFITCQNMTIAYDEHTAIEDLTGSFDAGSMTAIVGPNGGGKTTLLKAIKGFVKPSHGTLKFNGHSRRHVAYLPQTPEIDRRFPLTVRDVAAMGLCSRYGFFKPISKHASQLVDEALLAVGLENCANRPLHALSGGQFQRLLFARLSLQDAQIILLDEPFAAIDAPTMDILAGLLKSWQNEGKAIITVLHDLDIVRAFFPTTLILAKTAIAWGETKKVLTSVNLKRAKTESSSWELTYAGEITEGQEQ